MNIIAPYSFIAKHKVLADEEDKNKTGDEVFSTSSPAWWGLAVELRNFFEQGSAI